MTTPSWGVLPPVSTTASAGSGYGDQIAVDLGFGRRPEYTYLAADLFTDRSICELPLTDVTFSWAINEPGKLSGTLNVSTFGEKREYFAGTDPCKTVVYVIRDGVPIWGGIIWKRSFGSESRAMKIEAETWDSYLNRRIPFENIQVQWDDPLHPPATGEPAYGLEQIQMFRELWRYMSDAENGDIGVILGEGTSENRRGYTIAGADTQKNYMSWIKEVVIDKSNGFEWFATVGVAADGSRIERRIEFAAPKFGRDWEQTGLVWEYPGNLLGYSWISNGAESATVAYVLGVGTPPDQAKGFKKNQQAHNEGYPRIDWFTGEHKEVADVNILNSHAARYLYARTPPYNEIQIEPHPNVPISLGQYFIGDRIRLIISDDLFAHADIKERDLIARVLNLSVTVPDNGQEKVVPGVILDSRFLEIIDQKDANNEYPPEDWNGPTINPPNDFPSRPVEPDPAGAGIPIPAAKGMYGLWNARRSGVDPWLESRP